MRKIPNVINQGNWDLLWPNLFSVLFGMLGLVIGFVWLRYFSQKIRKDDRYRPVLLEIPRQKLAIAVSPQIK